MMGRLIVISCSLDSSLERAKYQGTIQADNERYSLFENFGSVVLLTQDTENYGKYLDKITHVPCAQSRFKVIQNYLVGHKLFRWLYFYFASFLWMSKNRRKIGFVITENITSPSPFLFSSLYGVPVYIQYHYDVATQVAQVNKSPIEGKALLFFERAFFKKAACVWVTASSLVEKVSKLGARKVTLLPNWYNFDATVAKPSKRSGTVEAKVVFVGRLHPVKRVDMLLEAFSRLKAVKENVTLEIVGDGPERKNLQELSAKLGLDKVTSFYGFQNHEKVMEIMSKADLLVMSSIMEGNPKVLIEAMMLRLPIVATNVPGIRDMLLHGETGHFAADDSPEGLARAMSIVLGNKEYADKISEAAYNFAKNHFSTDVALKRVRMDLVSKPPETRQLGL